MTGSSSRTGGPGLFLVTQEMVYEPSSIFSYHDHVYISQSARRARLRIVCCVRRFISPIVVEHTACLLERASATLIHVS